MPICLQQHWSLAGLSWDQLGWAGVLRPQLLKPGNVALELGASPGSWTQVLVKHGLRVVGCDLLPIEPVAGATLLQGDFTDPAVQRALLAYRPLAPGAQVRFFLASLTIFAQVLFCISAQVRFVYAACL